MTPEKDSFKKKLSFRPRHQEANQKVFCYQVLATSCTSVSSLQHCLLSNPVFLFKVLVLRAASSVPPVRRLGVGRCSWAFALAPDSGRDHLGGAPVFATDHKAVVHQPSPREFGLEQS